MKTIFETCTPRNEVLEAELRDEMFAARLRDVMEGNADLIYREAERFFDNTYPTEGLKTLLREALGRLSGEEPTYSPFIRLETSFGGGKTHNLIALYHLARGQAAGLPEDVVPATWVPSAPWPVAGIAGADMEPTEGIDHGELTTRTMWGEIAYQIGKTTGNSRALYEFVRASDEALVAPGTQVLEKVLGDGPALVMIDEVARYLRVAEAVSTPGGHSDLAKQTVAFLMSLIEFAASRPRVVVVVTLAESSDAFGRETGALRQELREARRISARQERVITPTGETEISAIVTHRLFQSIERDAARETAGVYRDYFGRLESQGVDIPQKALRSEYAAEMVQDYPFHPELLTTLNRKTATIPNFQKTRGALRLLARVVRKLWNDQPDDAHLICVHHLDLGLDDVANDLTSRLERPAFRSVIEADIASPRRGSVAHAQSIDRRWIEAGKPPYARRTAINVFLHSLTQGIATGVDPAELLLSVLQPEDDPHLVRKALALMLGEEKGEPGTSFWFLHWDGHRYRFKTEPSLEKIIQDEMSYVGRVKAKNELDERIKRIWKRSALRPVPFPAEAADLDDDLREPKLAILHYDAVTAKAGDPQPPELVAKLFNHAGTMEGYRNYKNNVMFLVADGDQVGRMVDVAQRYMAIRRLVGDSDRMMEFSAEQRKKLKSLQDEAELEVRVAVTRAYRYLYYPSGDAPKSSAGLARELIPAQDQGEVQRDQTAVVLRVLKGIQKVLTADDPALPPAFVKAKAWPHGHASLTTDDLRREFAKRLGLRMLLDLNQLKKTVKLGCTQGTWIYFDAAEQAGYGKPSPAPAVQFSEDALLYLPEEAERVGVRTKGSAAAEEPCPLCGQFECICEVENGDKTPTGVLTTHAEGPPGQVFEKIADEFHDRARKAVRRLFISCEGMGQEAVADARALGLAIPQLGRAEYRGEQTFNAEFGEPPEAESFSLSFAGSWDRYKRIKQITDKFGQEARKINLKVTLRVTFPNGLPVDSDQFEGLREVFTSLGMGRMAVDAEEATEEEPSK